MVDQEHPGRPPGRPPARNKASNERLNGPAATMKAVEAREKAAEEKRKEAANNKSEKENKKAEKTEARTKEKINKETIDEILKENQNNMENIEKKMDDFKNTVVDTLKDSIKEAMKEVATTIASAVTDGINQKDTKEDNLSTQRIIQDIEKMNQRLNTEEQKRNTNQTNQSTSDSDPTIQFNPNPDPEPEPAKEPKKPNPIIPTIYSMITKDELCKTINIMINRINELEAELFVLKDDNNAEKKEKTPKKIIKNQRKYLPSINIDIDGNPDPQEVDRLADQPLDFTTVKTARKFRQERPELPQHVNQTVSRELKDHLREQKTKAIKTRPQEEMEPETKEEKIRDMLNRQSLVIGAAPISNAHLEEVEKKMIARGVLDPNQPKIERKQRTIKSVIKSWAYKH